MIGMKKRKINYAFTVAFLCVVTLGLMFFHMVYGHTVYSLDTVVKILWGADYEGAFTIRTLRFPRMLAGLFCGFAFGMAGNTFQKLLNNSLASPDIIGVTSGSSVAAVFGILILKLSFHSVAILSVSMGIVVAAVIYLIAGGNHFNKNKLILTGIGMQAFLNALISWMLLKASQYDVPAAMRWMSGSLNGVKLEDVKVLMIVVVICTPVLLGLSEHLSILQLGDAHAITLGLSINSTRLGLILCALMLSAFATCVSGPIACVAFLSGPIASRVTKNSGIGHLAAGLVGAILVLASDLVGSYMFLTRYPVGVITGILGAPYLLVLLIRMNQKGIN